MADWETAEIWTGQTGGGMTITLWLHRGTGIWMNDTWRIEWSVSGGHRKGESHKGETVARAELERIKASTGDSWQQLD